jgi:transitional endoplasmic reticulum ATPase
VTERVISQFLTELDGIEELKGVLVLAATNRMDLIDPAIIRAGRFDLILELPMPDEKARLAILKIHTKGKPFDKSVDLEELAKKTEGLSGADLEVVAREAAMLAIREVLHSKAAKPEAVKISQEHFTEAMKQLVKQRGAHAAERPPH